MVESARAQIAGIDIRHQVIGDGSPVLMIHGWGASIDLLEPLAIRMGSHGFRCYLVDLPGFGESAEPKRAFSIFDYADFCSAYLDHHKLETAHYFGHSLGGRIGLVLGALHPTRVSKMVLSNSAGIRIKPAIHARLRLKLYQRIRSALRSLGAEAAADFLRQRYNQRYGSADYQSASPVMRQTLINIVNQDLRELAARVAAPTILIWGNEDKETPLWMGNELARTMPDAALVVHEGAGHYAYLDFPDKTAAIMRALYQGE